MFFDERFQFIKENSTSMPVGAAGAGNISPMVIKAPKNGYAYIYVSNASNQDVFFDNLKVADERGRLIEEDHYYAYGLKIAGLNSKKLPDASEVANIKNFRGYQGDFNEFDEDIGWNDFSLREYDPQIGRFTTPDPFGQFVSGYVGMGNDPINNIDPSGGVVFSSVGDDLLVGAAGGFIAGLFYGAITGNKDPLKMGAIGAGLGIAAMGGTDFLGEASQQALQHAGHISEGLAAQALNIYAQNIKNRESPFKDKNLPIGLRIPDIPIPILPVYQKEMPITYLHKLYAIVIKGKPIILTHKKGIARGNRNQLMKEPKNKEMYRDKDNVWRDEYPYASTEEGGPGASVWPVPADEQKIEREQLLQFYEEFLPNGGKFLVIPVPDNNKNQLAPEEKNIPDNLPLEILEKIIQRFLPPMPILDPRIVPPPGSSGHQLSPGYALIIIYVPPNLI